MAEQQLRRTFNHIERNAVSDYSKARFGACNLNHCYAQLLLANQLKTAVKDGNSQIVDNILALKTVDFDCAIDTVRVL